MWACNPEVQCSREICEATLSYYITWDQFHLSIFLNVIMVILFTEFLEMWVHIQYVSLHGNWYSTNGSLIHIWQCNGIQKQVACS